MSLSVNSKQLVHMLNILYVALDGTMCSSLCISLCAVLYIKTYTINMYSLYTVHICRWDDNKN